MKVGDVVTSHMLKTLPLGAIIGGNGNSVWQRLQGEHDATPGWFPPGVHYADSYTAVYDSNPYIIQLPKRELKVGMEVYPGEFDQLPSHSIVVTDSQQNAWQKASYDPQAWRSPGCTSQTSESMADLRPVTIVYIGQKEKAPF